MVSYTLKHYQKINGSDTIVIQIMYFLKFLSHDSIKIYVNTLDIAFVIFFYLFNKPKFQSRLFNLHFFSFYRTRDS